MKVHMFIIAKCYVLVAEKEESSIFKRSSRVKRSKKFFDDDDISNQTNKNKLKTKLPIKGKTNKK